MDNSPRWSVKGEKTKAGGERESLQEWRSPFWNLVSKRTFLDQRSEVRDMKHR